MVSRICFRQVFYFLAVKAIRNKKLIKEINKIEEADQPQTMHSALQTVLKIIAGSSTEIKILPDEESRLVEGIKLLLGPKEPLVTHLKNKKV
jgi:hypothetical protein